MDPEGRMLARRHLDARLDPVRRHAPQAPRTGWIRVTRDALGMSATELAARLGVSPQQVSQYEAAERSGSIKLQTLERVAEALGASLQYALVTELPLAQMVERRAREVASKELASVNHSMALEDQEPNDQVGDDRIERRARRLIDSRQLWTDR